MHSLPPSPSHLLLLQLSPSLRPAATPPTVAAVMAVDGASTGSAAVVCSPWKTCCLHILQQPWPVNCCGRSLKRRSSSRLTPALSLCGGAVTEAGLGRSSGRGNQRPERHSERTSITSAIFSPGYCTGTDCNDCKRRTLQQFPGRNRMMAMCCRVQPTLARAYRERKCSLCARQQHSHTYTQKQR